MGSPSRNQPEKAKPAFGVAVSVTWAPSSYSPAPETLPQSGCADAARTATHVCEKSTANQPVTSSKSWTRYAYDASVDSSSPRCIQPRKRHPFAGIAERLTVCPSSYIPEPLTWPSARPDALFADTFSCPYSTNTAMGVSPATASYSMVSPGRLPR